jgi:hypothetical protein
MVVITRPVSLTIDVPRSSRAKRTGPSPQPSSDGRARSQGRGPPKASESALYTAPRIWVAFRRRRAARRFHTADAAVIGEVTGLCCITITSLLIWYLDTHSVRSACRSEVSAGFQIAYLDLVWTVWRLLPCAMQRSPSRHR